MAAANISGIYEIVNTVNGKRYVGSSVNVARRWAQHQARLRDGTHHSPPLQRAWDKYGAGAFAFSVIETCARSDLIETEQRHLDQIAPAYNVARAAGYRTFLGLRHTPETIAKMSLAHRGNTRTKGKRRDRAAVEATAAWHRGAKRSDETKARISAARVGKKMPPRSEEHCRKISESLKGKPKSAAQMAALQEGRRRAFERRKAAAENN